MLWSLWIIYILFAEKFKTKMKPNIFFFITLILFMVNFRKNCAYI